MYTMLHSMPRKVELEDGNVFGPASRKRFGNLDTLTLRKCELVELLRVCNISEQT